jgi:hypothetical protein
MALANDWLVLPPVPVVTSVQLAHHSDRTEKSSSHRSNPRCGTLISNIFPLHERVARDARFKSPYVTVKLQYSTTTTLARPKGDDPLTFLNYCTAKTAEEISRARTTLPETMETRRDRFYLVIWTG